MEKSKLPLNRHPLFTLKQKKFYTIYSMPWHVPTGPAGPHQDEMISRGKQGEGALMISWGYIDDSTKGDTLVLSSVIVESSAGFWLELDWQSVIDKKNADLRNSGRPQISRFHSADCNACQGNFAGWDKELDQIPFMQSLQAVLQKYVINSIGYSVRIAEVVDVFPEATSGGRALAHVVLLCYLLNSCAEAMPIIGGTLCLIHDRGSFDSTFAQMDAALRASPSFDYGTRVMSLQRSSWEQSVLLQVADFMAYENSKVIVSIGDDRPWRRSLRGVVEGSSFGGRFNGITRQSLIDFRQYLDNCSEPFKTALYRAGRVAT
jgi:hypothetical protein